MKTESVPAWIYPVATAILALLIMACAAYWLWGKFSVSASGSAAVISRGVGELGSKQNFSLAGINGVCLAKSLREDAGDNDDVAHIIRLEGVDFYLEFGAGLPDDQRTFIALFLLQKRLEFGG